MTTGKVVWGRFTLAIETVGASPYEQVCHRVHLTAAA